MIIKIILSVITLTAGFAAFFTFLIMKNYQACVWAFMTGLSGCILLQIHCLRYKNRIGEYYTAFMLWSLAWIGFAMFALGISGFIYNIIIFAVLHIPILPVEHSVFISAVWCFLTFKTGAILFWYGRKYAHYVQIDRTKLLPSTSQQQQSADESA